MRRRFGIATAFSKRAGSFSEREREALADTGEALLEAYLDGKGEDDFWCAAAQTAFWEERYFPAVWGSALSGQGVELLLDLIAWYGTPFLTGEREKASLPFGARVFAIRRRERERMTILKVTGGVLRVKDTLLVKSREGEEKEEKVSQIYLCQGARNQSVREVCAGMLCAVTGLQGTRAGEGLGTETDCVYEYKPSFQSSLSWDKEVPAAKVVPLLKELEEEDPTLHFELDAVTGQLLLQMTGPIQGEVVAQLAKDRFGLTLSFGESRPVYLETIKSPVLGFGHYEPLRHYSEVALLLLPGQRGSGITFSSRCNVDLLPASFQNLVRTHVMERPIRGILTGSPLTDVHVVLIAGAFHIKHTEGGDFRQAVYRALRQGLEKAENQILEPYRIFTISLPKEHADRIGRILAALKQLGLPPEGPAEEDGMLLVSGRGPAILLAEFAERLPALTSGNASLFVEEDGYDLCHNPEEVIAAIGYDKNADLDYPSSSVFCAKGAGFTVPWDQAEQYMHTIKAGMIPGDSLEEDGCDFA